MVDALPDTEAVPPESPAAPIAHLGAVPPGPEGGKDTPPEPEVEDEEPVPPLLARVALVLLHPVEAFSRLDDRWGWLGVWGLLTACGLVVALVAVLKVDFVAFVTAEAEANMMPGTPPEARDMGVRIAVAMTRIGLFAGPILGPLLAGVVVGAVLFAASWALGGRRQFLRAFTAAFHAALVALVADLARLLGFVAGNPMPQTNLMNLADRREQPFVAWALMWVDPLYWWWVFLLGLALHKTMEVRRGRAIAATVALSLTPVLLMLGMTALQSFAMKAGGRP